MEVDTLERRVADVWDRDAGELRERATALRERANRQEASTVAGLSLDQAAATVVGQRAHPPTYFELFAVLKHEQAAGMNVVQFYYAMHRSPLVRMNGICVVQRKPESG